MTQPTSKRRFRFSLRTLLIAITLICIACGLWMRPLLLKRNAVLRFHELAAQRPPQPYTYKEEMPVTIVYEGDRAKPLVRESLHWLRDLVGEECFGTVFSVQLTDTPAKDDDLRNLAGVPTLVRLSLSGTKITDDGLLHLRACPNLRRLNLNDTAITDRGVAHLIEVQTLTSLSLRGTQITDEALGHLAQMPNLNQILLRDTEISDAAYRELQAALPYCKITADVPSYTQSLGR